MNIQKNNVICKIVSCITEFWNEKEDKISSTWKGWTK